MVPPLTRRSEGKRLPQEHYIVQIHPLSLSLSASPDEVLILSSVLCDSYFQPYFRASLRESKTDEREVLQTITKREVILQASATDATDSRLHKKKKQSQTTSQERKQSNNNNKKRGLESLQRPSSLRAAAGLAAGCATPGCCPRSDRTLQAQKASPLHPANTDWYLPILLI